MQPVHLISPQVLAKFIARLGLVSVLLLFVSNVVFAATGEKVFTDKNVNQSRRDQLSKSLQPITGWKNLHFDETGSLTFSGKPVGGSALARDLLTKAVSGPGFFDLKDASHRTDVVFCSIVPGNWTKGNINGSVSVILIDFADFDQVTGDDAAMAAFNVGWAVLHEMVHGVKNLEDTDEVGQVGDCEKLINQMRKECGVAEHAEYLDKMNPATAQSELASKYVRLAFDEQTQSASKKKRYWIVWDASIVGGSH